MTTKSIVVSTSYYLHFCLWFLNCYLFQIPSHILFMKNFWYACLNFADGTCIFYNLTENLGYSLKKKMTWIGGSCGMQRFGHFSFVNVAISSANIQEISFANWRFYMKNIYWNLYLLCLFIVKLSLHTWDFLKTILPNHFYIRWPFNRNSLFEKTSRFGRRCRKAYSIDR